MKFTRLRRISKNVRKTIFSMSVAKATRKYTFFSYTRRRQTFFLRTAFFYITNLIELLPLVITLCATIALIRSGVGSHLKTTFRASESMLGAVFTYLHPSMEALCTTARIGARFGPLRGFHQSAAKLAIV